MLFCQSGDISPNLVTLVKRRLDKSKQRRRRSKTEKSMISWNFCLQGVWWQNFSVMFLIIRPVRGKAFFVLSKIGNSRPLFSLFLCFQYSSQETNVQYNFCQWLDSNREPLVSEGTTLPTEPSSIFPSFLYAIESDREQWVDRSKRSIEGKDTKDRKLTKRDRGWRNIFIKTTPTLIV